MQAVRELPTASPSVPVVGRRRWPAPVRWLLWVLVAVVGSILLGFLLGLARPRVKAPAT